MQTIMLRRYKGRQPIEIMVDDDDYNIVMGHKWRSNTQGYIYTEIDGKCIYLHRMIMGSPDGLAIDHINRNLRDNRKSNLRVCTIQQNCMNAKRSRNNTSGHTGVSYRPQRKSWRAYIMVDRKQIGLGHYPTKEEAIKARREGERKYFGEFAPHLA